MRSRMRVCIRVTAELKQLFAKRQRRLLYQLATLVGVAMKALEPQAKMRICLFYFSHGSAIDFVNALS